MLLLFILNILFIIHNTSSLLCYNGTFTSRRYGEDPVTYRGLFGPSEKVISRTRCLLTTKCETRCSGRRFDQYPIADKIYRLVVKNEALLCYNCSSTQRDWTRCGGDFVPTTFTFNSTRMFLINCTGEYAMCFVRSWTARARHAWIVQRGCYQSSAEDTLPRTMTTPTRAMTCKHERQPEAEYKVCLCQADWCNSASSDVLSVINNVVVWSTYIIASIIIF